MNDWKTFLFIVLWNAAALVWLRVLLFGWPKLGLAGCLPVRRLRKEAQDAVRKERQP